jgi:hypothetical protein
MDLMDERLMTASLYPYLWCYDDLHVARRARVQGLEGILHTGQIDGPADYFPTASLPDAMVSMRARNPPRGIRTIPEGELLEGQLQGLKLLGCEADASQDQGAPDFSAEIAALRPISAAEASMAMPTPLRWTS